MLDINFIPVQQDNVKIFYARGTTDWQTWQKPRGCKFIWVVCIGGGTGGAGGTNGTGGAGNAGGGFGGPSGAITRALFPANVLPDILYVQTGTGGTGGASGGGSGGAATNSIVSIVPSAASSINIVCFSGAAVATAGLLSLGSFTTTAGLAGGDVTPLVSTIVTAGVTGANGGPSAVVQTFSLTSVSLSNITTPGYTQTNVNSGTPSNGPNGIAIWKPLFFIGGMGGGCFFQNAGNGGDGGNGSYGCGGGGGGGAYDGTGGNGGRGGDGLVIIATF
jgi:hypothetical protein